VDETRDARTFRSLGQTSGTLALDRVETLAAALVQDADEVDDSVDAAHGFRNGGRVGDVDAHRDDLPDIAHRLQEGRGDRIADRHADDIPARGEPPHQMTTDEPRAAENRHTARSRPHPTLLQKIAAAYKPARRAVKDGAGDNAISSPTRHCI
jgi:hypothetical protein